MVDVRANMAAVTIIVYGKNEYYIIYIYIYNIYIYKYIIYI